MNVNDIRPDELIEGMQSAQKLDIELLSSWKEKFREIDCPACGHAGRAFLYEYNVMHYQRCLSCGMQYISPRPTPNQLALFYSISANYAYWAKYIYPASENIRREKLFAPRAQLVADLCVERGFSGGGFVEVGPGYGLFLEELTKLAIFHDLTGIEPSSKLAEICRQKGLSVIEAPYEDVDPAIQVDVIASFEVIEHLYDPLSFAAWVHTALKPGGIVLLSCPNIEGLDTLMLGYEAAAVDHQHLNYFSPTTFRLLLERVGFSEIEIRTPGVLDVDLLRRAWKEGKINDAQMGPFLLKIIQDRNSEVDASFQAFLQGALLSSNMMAIARKK
jgi:2-polyprenyl-3-methyl-5-hydroxy-6-metoxy-1,4-benzoquinol methylase